MTNDEREQLDRRTDDQWARRMKSLEREFQRADRARQKRPVRQSLPIAITAGLLVVLTAVLVVRSNQHTSPNPRPTPAQAVAVGPFADSPAATWQEASKALVLPHVGRLGPFSAPEVRSALARARSFLLTARADPTVLSSHDVTVLKTLVDPQTFIAPARSPVQQRLIATFLAPRNALSAPVRLLGTVTARYAPQQGRVAQRLVVSANLVWAYALDAPYPLAQIPSKVVAIHERLELSFYLSKDMSGPSAKPSPTKDDALWFDTDCGYFKQRLLGLPRADDPDALPGVDNGVSQNEAFDPNSTVNASAHVCRGS